MTKKILLTSVLSAVLFGCSTTPYVAPQAQIDAYFDNMKIAPQAGEVEHKDHGKMKATENPYAADYNQCQEEAFKGNSFLFGSREVTNPKQLSQASSDYMKEIFTAFLAYKNGSGSAAHAGATVATAVSSGTALPNANYKQPSKTIFEDKQILSNIKVISGLETKTLECAKAKGWSYVSAKK